MAMRSILGDWAIVERRGPTEGRPARIDQSPSMLRVRVPPLGSDKAKVFKGCPLTWCRGPKDTLCVCQDAAAQVEAQSVPPGKPGKPGFSAARYPKLHHMKLKSGAFACRLSAASEDHGRNPAPVTS
jgi:hypothetical protein